MRLRHMRARAGATAGLAAAMLAATVAPAIAAHVLHVTDRAQLKLVGSHQNTLVETGKVTGTIPGTVKVSFTLHGLHATSHFTIYAKGGNISGVGYGKVKSGRRGYDTFGGSLRLTGGSGRYRRAFGSGKLYGSLYKLNESLRVQVYGTLHQR